MSRYDIIQQFSTILCHPYFCFSCFFEKNCRIYVYLQQSGSEVVLPFITLCNVYVHYVYVDKILWIQSLKDLKDMELKHCFRSFSNYARLIELQHSGLVRRIGLQITFSSIYKIKFDAKQVILRLYGSALAS